MAATVMVGLGSSTISFQNPFTLTFRRSCGQRTIFTTQDVPVLSIESPIDQMELHIKSDRCLAIIRLKLILQAQICSTNLSKGLSIIFGTNPVQMCILSTRLFTKDEILSGKLLLSIYSLKIKHRHMGFSYHSPYKSPPQVQYCTVVTFAYKNGVLRSPYQDTNFP